MSLSFALPAGLAVALLVLLVLLDRLALRVLRPPRRPPGDTPRRHATSVEDVAIPRGEGDGPVLRGWLLLPDDAGDPAGPGPGVAVLCHGWATNAAVLLPMAAHLRRAGHPVFLFDVRAHGRSGDAPYVTVRHFRDDVERALAWVGTRFPTRAKVAVGHSMGGAAVVLAAVHGAEVHGVATVAAPADVLEVTAIHMERKGLPGRWLVPLLSPFFWWRAGASIRHFSPERRLPELEVPVVVLHPETDASVPVEHAHRLARAAGTTPRVVEDTDHASILESPEAADAVRDLLARLPTP